MDLAYITRGNSSPKGKPRVYISGHPMDCINFRNDLADEILSHSNCVIYYNSQPNQIPGQEELNSILRQMQLFVIPVTSNLLYQKNYAKDVEIPFALEHHIPLLPLLLEDGVEERFNEVFNNLQVLNKKRQSVAAIPYTERLGKFLETVLVGDKLAKQVRAAFSSYIFLSYRQKDRMHAQELMRLIHKDDSCRDIAIWYDEYLVPGENFNNSILNAIRISDLFVMVITPNILTEDNYVINCEYPYAATLGKQVIPVEMVSTPRNELQNCFPDIPESVNVYDNKTLSRILSALVPRTSSTKNNQEEHAFLIGIAYLNGIDVEVNHEYALSLITNAAEAGLPEAIKKLVEMYNTGNAVERDYRKAIHWQEKLIERRRLSYDREKSETNGRALISALKDLGGYYTDICAFSEAKAAYETANRYCQEMLLAGIDLHLVMAANYRKLGMISHESGQTKVAKKYLDHALKLFKELPEDARKNGYIRELSATYEELGDFYQSTGNISRAKEYYEESLELLRSLTEGSETASHRHNLAAAYIDLGDIAQKEGCLLLAKQYYTKALELSQVLVTEIGSTQECYGLANIYGKLGLAEQAMGHWEAARKDHLKAMEMSKTLYAKDKTSIQGRRHLADCHMALGGFCADIDSLDEARECYQKAISLYESLAKEIKGIGEIRDLSLSHQKMGNVNWSQGNVTEAQKSYITFLKLCRKASYKSGSSLRARAEVFCMCTGLIMLIRAAYPFVKVAFALKKARNAY